jgi:hypothetical protein
VQLANSVSLDFAHDHGQPHAQHYAFIVTEQEFDEIPGRIIERGITYLSRLRGIRHGYAAGTPFLGK